MRITVLVVGRARHAGLADAIADYERRAARYWPLDIIEVREESARRRRSEDVRDKEGERIAARIPESATVVVCDPPPAGEGMTSEAFASFIQGCRERDEHLAFVIGGAYGVAGAVQSRAKRRLSLAPWTLPHELARLVLAEQLYRAGTIQRGEPYHK